ncbi:uncharacterized protein K460DRAFT_405107 [Cucurbitaria berberidis CBS 394.84]|uniref:Uncharacterized protein n=1 Tax=Cucurbitaria berberidis CBS 394.84 TaxID=1168544 RepID=A0A9P4GF06_9PLEO|nr:uncharacterized protein K460DRAFT_405107 [Cucurbitaria berberidis CBS 394.84]KAF1844828.1 hypothetical protein K460DRAFT_405107 [Cucurbitaria berberidis CBS 394.84]
MSPKISLRRSERLLKQRNAVQDESCRIQKPIRIETRKKTQTTTRSKSSISNKVKVESSKSSRNHKAETNVSHLIEHSASDTEDDCSMEGSEEETDDEFNESANMSTDNVAFVTADIVDRRESCDSRYEPGNESYQIDDFVVQDDYETEDESETETKEGGVDDEFDQDYAPAPQQTIERKADFDGQSVEDEDPVLRKTSVTSTRSESSALFVSDPDDPPEPLEWCPTDPRSNLIAFLFEYEIYMGMNVIDAALEDIVEEIMDAVGLFSRRCNRKRTPLRLRLSSKILDDGEVCDALQTAERLGLGRGMNLGDGTEGWVIGPSR